MNKVIIGSVLTTTVVVGSIYIPRNREKYLIIPNYNGQSHLLLSLQITPDYIPLQFKKRKLSDFISKPSLYMVGEEETKKKLKNDIDQRMSELLSSVKEYGPSLWNKELYDTGAIYRNDQFWKTKETDLVILEQFLIDDYLKESEISVIPKHRTKIVTNFRLSKDPYTVLEKAIFEDDTNQLAKKFSEYLQSYQKEERDSLYRFGKFVEFWKNKVKVSSDLSTSSKLDGWLVGEDESSLFYKDKDTDTAVSKLYIDALFSQKDKNLLNTWESGWKASYIKKQEAKKTSVRHIHHPALEHQIIPGTAPLSEGSQKENMIYLLHLAKALKEYADDYPASTNDRPTDPRITKMKSALKNAEKISDNYRDRLTKLKKYTDHLKDKTIAIVTYPPTGGGGGDLTLQTISKFPFIFKNIKQPLPSQKQKEKWNHSFSIDDNGWWWNLGNENVSSEKLNFFQGTADILIFLATESDKKILETGHKTKLNAMKTILKNSSSEIHWQPYHLWNEGLRSPLSLNLVMDQLIKVIHQELKDDKQETDYKAALEWGDYWTENFVKGTDAAEEQKSV